MKNKLFFVLIFFLCCFTACEKHLKSSEVPPLVTKSFKAKYPGATAVEWEIKSEIYEASFVSGKDKMKAVFNEDGSFVKETHQVGIK